MHAQVRDRGARALSWLRGHDPGLAATRRAGRTAIVMPGLLAFGDQVLHEPAAATFGAFGSFAMLLMVEYGGPMVQRLRAQVGLAVAWVVLVSLGTIVSRTTWLAVVLALVVTFVVLFAGVVSSVLAGSATSLLLAFILPVTTPAPLSKLPQELTGVGLAAAASLLAISLLWPRPAADPLSTPAARVCRAVAAELRAAPASSVDGRQAATAAAELRRAFDAVPYRPTGLSAGSRALVRLVDELTWLSAIIADMADSSTPGLSSGLSSAMSPGTSPGEQVLQCDPEARLVRATAAAVLDAAADLLDDLRGDPGLLRSAMSALSEAMGGMVNGATARLPMNRPPGEDDAEVSAFIGTLDLSFRAQELAFATLQVAGNVELAAAAEQRSWRERLLGREPGEGKKPLAAAWERALSHARWDSVWLHNSLRGAIGLCLAVALAEVTSVQHSFWISLGTLSVLRSNALNTGQNALRAVTGTVAGSIIGTGLLLLIGHHGNVLWLILPFAVLIAGVAPAAISFTAGQAAFTVTLVVLFNVGQDPNWHIVLLRVQDIALGCGVSVVVALFFWPRGAAAAVDKALAAAYTDSARYLATAVKYALSRCGSDPISAEVALQDGRQAAAAARRLDDAFRSYLAERGRKHVPLADMTTLVTGVVGLRLAADAVISLWRQAGDARLDADGAQARIELLGAADRVTEWYRRLADGLDRGETIPGPVQRNPRAAARLVESVRRDLADEDGQATANAVRIIWTGDHVDAARRLQPSLAAVTATLVHA